MRDEDKTKEQLIQELAGLRKQLAETRGQGPKTEEVCVQDEQGPVCAVPDAETAYGTMDPWLPIETKLVVRSIGMGVIILIVLAILVNVFLLGGH
jgi:hypothetical protein